jgi:hypothetical protein
MASRCRVAPHDARFAGGRIHWLPHGTMELGRPTGLAPVPADSRSAVLLLHHGQHPRGIRGRSNLDLRKAHNMLITVHARRFR